LSGSTEGLLKSFKWFTSSEVKEFLSPNRVGPTLSTPETLFYYILENGIVIDLILRSGGPNSGSVSRGIMRRD
jgi:hypothetical protein